MQRAEKFNRTHRMVRFRENEKVLVRANPVGKSEDNTAWKFFQLFEGPIHTKRESEKKYICRVQRTARYGHQEIPRDVPTEILQQA